MRSIKRLAALILGALLLYGCSLKPYSNSFSLRVAGATPVESPFQKMFLLPTSATGFPCYAAFAGGPSIPALDEGGYVDLEGLWAGDSCAIYPGISSAVTTSLSDVFSLTLPQDLTTFAVIGLEPLSGVSCPVGQNFLEHISAYDYEVKDLYASMVRVTNQPTIFPFAGQELVLSNTYNSADPQYVAGNSCHSEGSGDPMSVSGLVAWYAAENLLSDPVTSWTDSSGYGNDLVGGAYGSVVRVTGPNGYYAANFPTASLTRNSGNNGPVNGMTAMNGITIFVVTRTLGLPSASLFGHMVGVSTGLDFISGSEVALLEIGEMSAQMNAPVGKVKGANASAVLAYNPTAADTTSYHVYTLHGGPSTWSNNTRLYRDGNLIGTSTSFSGMDTSINIASSGRIDVGARLNTTPSTWGSDYQGYIAEIAIYNREISDTERSQIECYFAQKFGLSSASCS